MNVEEIFLINSLFGWPASLLHRVVFLFAVAVKHKYPFIGEPNPNAIEFMREYTEKFNVGWILDTMRSGKLLEEAIGYIESHGIKLYGVGINPTQHAWTSSSKPYGIYRWDDNSAGAPKICEDGERPYLDWVTIDKEMRPILERLANV